MAITVVPISAFTDNYIWCLQQDGHCAVVDPGDATPVLAYLKQHELKLTDILITHHHADHIGGLGELVNAFPEAQVFGADSGRIPHLTHQLKQGDKINLSGVAAGFEVIEVPGHTRDHIAFYGEVGLFCGDTLFSAGCGRLFEGTPAQMQDSLAKLTALPGHTKVYCTHEYTLANLAFANEVEPDNQALQNYRQWAEQQRQAEQPTLPSTLDEQQAINPFLRVTAPQVREKVQARAARPLTSTTEVFAELRRWKDAF